MVSNVDGEAAAEALLEAVWVSYPLSIRDPSILMATWKGAEIWQHGTQLILAKNFVQRSAAGKAWLRGKAGAEKLALLASRNETKKAACVAEEANWAIAFGRKQKLADEKTLKDKQAKDKEEQETQLILKAEFIEQGKKEMMEEVRQKEEDQAATAANGSDAIMWASGLAISQRGGATRIQVDPFNANRTCVGLGSFAANTGNEPPPPHPALAMCLNPKP
jgi:hypothetical protein